MIRNIQYIAIGVIALCLTGIAQAEFTYADNNVTHTVKVTGYSGAAQFFAFFMPLFRQDFR